MRPEVRVERAGSVVTLTVDRPAALNALAPETMVALGAAVERLVPDASVGALVLAGGGGRFLSGGDLKILAELREAEPAAEMARRMRSTLAALAGAPFPVLAAVERFAYGGGAEVALACDLIVADHDAVLCFRHGDFGLTTAWGGARRLAARVGAARARRLLWTSAVVPAAEALRLGLVDQLAPPGTTALRAAQALAAELVTRSAQMLTSTKRLLAAPEDPAGDALETALFSQSWASAAHWERVEAFWQARRAAPKAPPSPRGRFIVLEGIDGAGTTTQARLLARWLRRAGRPVLQTAEPSGGPIGVLLRQALSKRVVGRAGERLDPRAIAALFAADRADHLSAEIEPALAAGVDVVCDRYALSSLAYQGVECAPAWVAGLNAPMRAPDLTLLLRVDVQIAAARRAARAGEPEIYEVDAFQRRVVEGYERAPAWRPRDGVVPIDGAASVRAVQRRCRRAIEALGSATARG